MKISNCLCRGVLLLSFLLTDSQSWLYVLSLSLLEACCEGGCSQTVDGGADPLSNSTYRWHPTSRVWSPAPATLTCLINPSDFPILTPAVEAEAPSPPYLVRNTASFQPLTCRGSKPVQPEKEDIKWDEKEEQGELMIVLILMMMHQSRSILQTGLAGRRRTSSKSVSGVVLAEAGQSLLDTVFNQTVFLFVLLFTVLYFFVLSFYPPIVSLVSRSENPETIFAWSGEIFPHACFDIFKIYPVTKNAA